MATEVDLCFYLARFHSCIAARAQWPLNSQSVASEKEYFELATSGGFFVFIFTAIKWEMRREDKKNLCWCKEGGQVLM